MLFLPIVTVAVTSYACVIIIVLIVFHLETTVDYLNGPRNELWTKR